MKRKVECLAYVPNGLGRGANRRETVYDLRFTIYE